MSRTRPASQPDRTDLTVSGDRAIHRRSCSWAWAIPRPARFVGEFSYTEQNLFGRGQISEGVASRCRRSAKQYQFSFTEPYFLDRPLAAGFDLYKAQTDYQQATYSSDTTGVQLRLGFPISEYSIGGPALHLSDHAGLAFRQRAAGDPARRRAAPMARSSASPMATTRWTMSANPPPAWPSRSARISPGFGGNLKFIKTEAQFSDLPARLRRCGGQFAGAAWPASSGL